MPFATDDEIIIAHNILLKGKDPFDEPRINVIKEDNSCYVQAAPGSGKTTVLLTKLIILANRMPLPEGKGVCVLTHTNVAIDEIKAKLGSKADVLFKYPNFFGTIQTFLHKYVASAALHYFYGSQITYVNNEIAKAAMLKKFRSLCYGNKLKNYVYGRLKHTKKNQNSESEIILSSKVDWNNNKIIIDTKPIGIDTDTGVEYMKLKREMFIEGILSFDDAYDLAFRYIREKNLDFSSFSDKRFQYLFVDEVQDCNNKQVELIRKLFADDKVVVQRFGDYGQAIFDSNMGAGTENNELKGDRVRHIHNSNRFGNRIALPLKTLCIENNQLLEGNPNIPSAKPIIISYENPLSVLPKFEAILSSTFIPEMGNISVLDIAKKEKREDPLHRVNVKACGWVGKKPTDKHKRHIGSYFSAFESRNVKARMDEDSFDEDSFDEDSFDDYISFNSLGTVKKYAKSIIQGILKFLDLCDVKNDNRRFNRKSLLAFLTKVEKKEEFLCNVMKWSLSVVQNNKDKFHGLKEVIYQYLTESLLPLFDKKITNEADSFFKAALEVTGESDKEKDNIFHGNSIDIEVCTVHSVKGETHCATLYLETSYQGSHESERLSDQFKGIPYTGTNQYSLESLKVAYVGMSRPRYLLCAAIQKDRFRKMDCPELRKIWDVVECQ